MSDWCRVLPAAVEVYWQSFETDQQRVTGCLSCSWSSCRFLHVTWCIFIRLLLHQHLLQTDKLYLQLRALRPICQSQPEWVQLDLDTSECCCTYVLHRQLALVCDRLLVLRTIFRKSENCNSEDFILSGQADGIKLQTSYWKHTKSWVREFEMTNIFKLFKKKTLNYTAAK